MKKRISIITRPSKRIARFATVIALLAAMPLSPTVAAADKWVEARSPNFIVVSNAGESQARKTAIQFEQVRALFRQSLAAAQTHASPVMIIFAVKNEDSLRELLPEYWAQRGQSHPGGIFVNRLYQFSMAVNLAAHGDNPYEAIYHEYYHSLTMPYFPGLPLWVAEGLADFYGNSEISDKTAGLGRPNPGLITVLRSLPLIPLETLFQVNQRSPYYSEQSKVSIFYAESWALIHYLMLGDKGIHREALLKLNGCLARLRFSRVALMPMARRAILRQPRAIHTRGILLLRLRARTGENTRIRSNGSRSAGCGGGRLPRQLPGHARTI